MTQPHDDEYGDVLRRLLRAEAGEITPSAEGLERIRARTRADGRDRAWWQVPLTGGAFAMPWVRPALAVGGALVIAAVVMAGTPGIRHSVMAAFRGAPNTPAGPMKPVPAPTHTRGYPTNGTGPAETPTNAGGKSQGPGGGPCAAPTSGGGGTVTALHTPQATTSPSACVSHTPRPTTSTEPTEPTHPTTGPGSPPPHSSPPPATSDSPTANPHPSNSNPAPASSP